MKSKAFLSSFLCPFYPGEELSYINRIDIALK